MIRAERPWNTDCIKLEETKKYYCSYCQEEMAEFTEIDHRDSYTYRSCTCLKALIQHEIDSYLPKPHPQKDIDFIKEIEYQNEIYKVNRKFGK